MRMNKKGAELAMNVIIVAVIALIVLIVTIYIFTSKTKTTSTTISGLGSCESRGGHCSQACLDTETRFYKFGCPNTDKNPPDKADAVYCCIP